MSSLVLKRASASRSSGEWNDDDFDVLARRRRRPHHEGRRCADRHVMDVDARVRIPRGPHTDARLRADARGRDGGVRQELAAAVSAVEAKTEVETTSILPSKMKTARSWRGIFAFTHLAREGRMTVTIGRRELLVALGGAAAWPLAARAQQSNRMRRIGVLMGLSESDPEAQSRIAAFRKTLQDLGWTEARNVRTDYYWAAGDIDRTHALAKELVSSALDVIVVNTPPGLSALRVETHTISIVFVQVLDASESTVVLNPARPESNVTGFTNFYEYAVSGKWLALLKEIAPSVSRVAILQNPNHPSWAGYQGSIAKAAPLLGVQPIRAHVYTPADIDNILDALAREPNGGLLVLPDTFTTVHRDKIVALADHHRLPAVYPLRFFATSGGLMAYGADLVELLRLSASYVDRILRGARPSDLPVKSSSKFELIIN